MCHVILSVDYWCRVDERHTHATLGSHSIRSIVQGWINDFKRIASLVKRLDATESGDFTAEIVSHQPIQQASQEILQLVAENDIKCEEIRSTYLQFATLWKVCRSRTLTESYHSQNDVNVSFAEFLRQQYGDTVTSITLDSGGLRSLPAFDQKIGFYRKMQVKFSLR